jgi:hypothetical protein
LESPDFFAGAADELDVEELSELPEDEDVDDVDDAAGVDEVSVLLSLLAGVLEELLDRESVR